MKKLLLVIGGLVAVVLILGVIAPTDVHIEKDIVINKPVDVVFNNLKYIKSHTSWSPWMKKDPNVVNEYRGEDGTVGFVNTWSGNDEVGVGEQEVKNIVEGSRIDVELRFKKPMEGIATSYLTTEPTPEGQTKVTWGMDEKMKFPINVICLLMSSQKMIEKEFQSGLESLKLQLEAQQ